MLNVGDSMVVGIVFLGQIVHRFVVQKTADREAIVRDSN